MLERLLRLLGGVGQAPAGYSEPHGFERDASDPLPLFGTFPLRDGHQIASDLQRNNIPFAVELDDGIDQVSAALGSGGHEATLSLYLDEAHWEVLNDIIKIRFGDG